LRLTWTVRTVAITALSGAIWAQAQSMPAASPVGKVIPKVTCIANDKESYALYLPSSFVANRKWPIVYVFDPFGRGPVAVETVRPAAEKYGYIVVASNNSRNGPQGGSGAAAQAMWLDTEQRFPIDEGRRYFAGMSGGARVAAALALGCRGCVAGVIANAAGFPDNATPTADMKFAYFAALGNADMNYPEFVELRSRLNDLGIHYRIRVFEGDHGWAPPGVWTEALNWMDLQAMAGGRLARDSARIQETMSADLERARGFETKREWLTALREYQAITRDFAGLADTAIPKSRVAELEKNKQVGKLEKQEREDVTRQNRLMAEVSMHMQTTGDPASPDLVDTRNQIATLKRDAARASNERDRLVLRRALVALVIQAFESGERSLQEKDYRAALQYFDWAAAGSDRLGWAHYQRARAFAGTANKKQMLAELRLSLAAGFHDSAALDAEEFAHYRQDPEFQALALDWKKAAEPFPPAAP
jgi:dienelactone hydrolase